MPVPLFRRGLGPVDGSQSDRERQLRLTEGRMRRGLVTRRVPRSTAIPRRKRRSASYPSRRLARSRSSATGRYPTEPRNSPRALVRQVWLATEQRHDVVGDRVSWSSARALVEELLAKTVECGDRVGVIDGARPFPDCKVYRHGPRCYLVTPRELLARSGDIPERWPRPEHWSGPGSTRVSPRIGSGYARRSR